MLMGTRGGLEPLCINPSRAFTKSDNPAKLMKEIRDFSTNSSRATVESPPSCYPANTQLPPNNQAPLVNRVDAYTEFTPDHEAAFRSLLEDTKELSVHGEPLTTRSPSERVNYLLLLWYFLKGNEDIYMQMNSIAMDFVQPAIVHRIVAAMQEKNPCGYEIHCVDSGSCFAADLHGPGDECLEEKDVQRLLRSIGEMRIFHWKTRYNFFYFLFIMAKSLLLYAFTTTPSSKPKEKPREDKEDSEETPSAAGSKAASKDSTPAIIPSASGSRTSQ